MRVFTIRGKRFWLMSEQRSFVSIVSDTAIVTGQSGLEGYPIQLRITIQGLDDSLCQRPFAAVTQNFSVQRRYGYHARPGTT
jgi:hypothetical protein